MNSSVLTETHIQKASLFFLYLFLNEAWVLEGLRESSHRFLNAKSHTMVDWVKVLHREALKIFSKKTSPQLEVLRSERFQFPENFSYEKWLQFQKALSFQELEVLALGAISNFSHAEIAEGLDISEGTVRMRLHFAFSTYAELGRASLKLVVS